MGDFQYLGLECPKHTEKHVSAKLISHFHNYLTNQILFESQTSIQSPLTWYKQDHTVFYH